MSRRQLRLINQMKQDYQLINSIYNSEQPTNTPISTLVGRDADTGKLQIRDRVGGSSLANVITNSGICARGQIIPVTMSNGTFKTVDALPS